MQIKTLLLLATTIIILIVLLLRNGRGKQLLLSNKAMLESNIFKIALIVILCFASYFSIYKLLSYGWYQEVKAFVYTLIFVLIPAIVILRKIKRIGLYIASLTILYILVTLTFTIINV